MARNTKSLFVKCSSSLVAVIIAMTGMTSEALAVANTQSMAIPAYEYPTLTNLWPEIDTAGSQIPFVIVNPASGPGASENSDYTTRIATNTSEGIRSVGYVDTNYQSRPIADVIDDISTWYQLYPGISGIFLDRVSVVDDAALCYSAYAHNYIKARDTGSLTIQNFGTYTSPSYEPYGDIFVNAEMDYTLYQTWVLPNDGFQDNSTYSDRFWHLVHFVAPGDYTTVLDQTRTNNAGWVYVTDDTLPNPYDAAASYFSDELTNIAAVLPPSSIPNRGLTDLPAGCLDIVTNTSSSTDPGTTTGTFSFTNTSPIYTAPSLNRIAFTLPAGVSLTSNAGTGWTCNDTECTYAIELSADASSSELNTSFAADCSYESGDIIATSTVFPATQSTTSLAVEAPNNCTGTDGDEELADTGSDYVAPLVLSTILLAAGGLLLIHRRQTL